MFGLSRIWLDISAGVGLVIALLVVIALDRLPAGTGTLPVHIISNSPGRLALRSKVERGLIHQIETDLLTMATHY